ncbi:MAG: GntR family transcriptional regulator [Actinomycetota bacterium]|jgi:DNA-binding GntR family transcriptional regulator|nr:GntR family transcriptional regulator [Actinomycetota bacterium]
MTENLPDIGVRVSPVSTVEAAANALRELILDGNLEPGARLREHDFAERLGIARHSFRAATQILINEGLLKREPHRGVEVAVLATDDVADIFKLRDALEIEAVRIVTEAGVVPAEAQRAVSEMSALSADAPWREVVWPDQRFHRAIIDATNSPRLIRAYQGLQSEIVLCLAQLRPVYDAPAEVAAEHEELLAPVIAGDVDRAVELFRAHLDEAAANLIGLHAERSQETESGA